MLRIEKVAGKDVLMESEIPFLKLFKKGKVREVYELGDYLLIVATDRISAFDVVMKTGVPSKGIYLTQQSAFWFKFIRENGFSTHFVSDDLDEIAEIVSGGDFEAGLEVAELSREISRFLFSVDETKRNVFIRRYWHYDSIESICRRYGFGKSKVLMILKRTRDDLAQHLKKEGFIT